MFDNGTPRIQNCFVGVISQVIQIGMQKDPASFAPLLNEYPSIIIGSDVDYHVGGEFSYVLSI